MSQNDNRGIRTRDDASNRDAKNGDTVSNPKTESALASILSNASGFFSDNKSARRLSSDDHGRRGSDLGSPELAQPRQCCITSQIVSRRFTEDMTDEQKPNQLIKRRDIEATISGNDHFQIEQSKTNIREKSIDRRLIDASQDSGQPSVDNRAYALSRFNVSPDVSNRINLTSGDRVETVDIKTNTSRSALRCSNSKQTSVPDTRSYTATSSPTLGYSTNLTHCPSLSRLDSNNNTGQRDRFRIGEAGTRREGSSGSKQAHFSHSTSGDRLDYQSNMAQASEVSKNSERSQDLKRRPFLEEFYNVLTQQPSTSSSSSPSYNAITPLNRLNECDAITTRLLSSPTRVKNQFENTTRRPRSYFDFEKSSRRSSLGTSGVIDQKISNSPMAFKSLDLNVNDDEDGSRKDDEKKCDIRKVTKINEANQDSNLHLNQQNQQQQQSRSLSVCEDESMNSRTRDSSSGFLPSLSRAISLACEPRTSSVSKRTLNVIPLFGCDIESLRHCIRFGFILPPIIDSAVTHIVLNGINSVGIFRKSGVKSRIQTLRQNFESNQTIRLDDLNRNNEYSIYDVADLVKMWFRELKPVPLVTKELIRLISNHIESRSSLPTATRTATTKRGIFDDVCQSETGARNLIPGITNSDDNLKRRINAVITETHRILLSRALDFLGEISSKADSNQMTSQNLAICLTPSLCATEPNQKSVLIAQRVLEYCIDNSRLFSDDTISNINKDRRGK